MRKIAGVLMLMMGAMIAGAQTTGPATRPETTIPIMTFLKTLPATLRPKPNESPRIEEQRTAWYADHAKGKKFSNTFQCGTSDPSDLFSRDDVADVDVHMECKPGQPKFYEKDTLSIVGEWDGVEVRQNLSGFTFKVKLKNCDIKKVTPKK